MFGSQSRGYLDQAATPLEIPEHFGRMPGVTFNGPAPLPASLPMAFAMRRMCDEIEGAAVGAAPDFAQALHVQAIIDAAERSSADNKWADLS